MLQLALPIALISWLALAPIKNRIGYAIQVVSTGLLVLALYVVGLWMMLPWWTPLAYGLLWLLAIVLNWRKETFVLKPQPVTVSSWIIAAVLLFIGIFSLYLVGQGMRGRQPQGVRVVDLAMPMPSGNYLVANGGSSELINAHMMTLNLGIERFRRYRGQSYGIDLIKVNQYGFRSKGLQPRDPTVYEIYGEPVIAPCDGSVITSRNDRPDMPVPTMDREVIAGNHVLLSCDDFVVLLAHFKQGSVRVRAGDRVGKGDYLGVVGNSGKTGEPHLHISAQLPGSVSEPLSGEPLAINIDGKFLVRNDVVRVADQ
jgi:hypothetical protein